MTKRLPTDFPPGPGAECEHPDHKSELTIPFKIAMTGPKTRMLLNGTWRWVCPECARQAIPTSPLPLMGRANALVLQRLAKFQKPKLVIH